MKLSSRSYVPRLALPTRLVVSVALVGLVSAGCGGSVAQDAGTCDGAPSDPNSLQCVDTHGAPCSPSYVCVGGTCPTGCFAEPLT